MRPSVRSLFPKQRKWHDRAYGVGLFLGAGVLALTTLPQGEWFHARGTMNVGHDALSCGDCHLPAAGTLRQQLQANVRFAMGLREKPATFGRLSIGNEPCQRCHERPDDRHPVYRFFEPRFAEARSKVAPHRCVSCHAEHTGRRVSLEATGICATCHRDTKVKDDPIDVEHAELISSERWDTCLGCHDFHGNHVMKTERSMSRRASTEAVRAYFAGGRSPYGDEVRYRAKKVD